MRIIMNKIKVVNNRIIPFDCDDVLINESSIRFMKNGDCYIEYIDSDNVSININIDSNVCINLFEYSENEKLDININYNLDKKASLILSKFYCNGNTKAKITINLREEKANIKYNFSSISNGIEDYNVNIYHLAKQTTSDVFNKVIARENSSNFFDINSFVENGIKDCTLNQQTRIITLGDSDNRINPNMFIGENSTVATHSSTIGSISDDDLFYLMSRGIAYKDSVNLIIKGMILSNINTNMETREKILKILDGIGGE